MAKRKKPAAKEKTPAGYVEVVLTIAELCASLASDSPHAVKEAADLVAMVDAVRQFRDEGNNDLAVVAAFLTGFLTSNSLATGSTGQTMAAMVSGIKAIQKGRAKGGRTRRKWTAEIDALARKLNAGYASNLTEDTKAKRIASKVGVSVATVRRNLFNGEH